MRSRRLKVPTWLLLRIAARDKWKCRICGDGYDAREPWEIHHKLSLARGGTNHVKNLVLTHRSCNRDLGAA